MKKNWHCDICDRNTSSVLQASDLRTIRHATNNKKHTSSYNITDKLYEVGNTESCEKTTL